MRLGFQALRSPCQFTPPTWEAPVAQRVFGVEPFYIRNEKFAASVRANLYSTAVTGYHGSTFLSGTLRVYARLSRDLTIGYGIDDYRLAGVRLPGADTVIYLIGFPCSQVSLVDFVVSARRPSNKPLA